MHIQGKDKEGHRALVSQDLKLDEKFTALGWVRHADRASGVHEAQAELCPEPCRSQASFESQGLLASMGGTKCTITQLEVSSRGCLSPCSELTVLS